MPATKSTTAKKLKPLVLVVDDNQAEGENARVLLSEHFDVEVENAFEAGLARLLKLAPAVVLLDIYDGDEPKGLELLSRIRAMESAPPVVMITREKSPEIVVECIRRGAYDYLTKKPFDRQRAIQVIRQTIERSGLKARLEALERERAQSAAKLVWASPAMARVMERIAKAAPTDAAVLITGETGTGKDLAAEEIHRSSSRHAGLYLPINCAAFPPSLLESELFGHEQGAFTDAKHLRRGIFERAAGGTLFLDEVGDCTSELQARLLQVLEKKCFTRVGGEEVIDTNVRIIAATHRDLSERVEAGIFREDLFYRFSQYRIHIPPLRDRTEDILPLAAHFLAIEALANKKKILGLTPAAEHALLNRTGKGNIRSLRNTIANAVINCSRDQLDVDDIIDDPWGIGEEIKPYHEERELLLKRFKVEYFTCCLKVSEGNVAHAARLAGRSTQAVRNTLREIGLEREGFKPKEKT